MAFAAPSLFITSFPTRPAMGRVASSKLKSHAQLCAPALIRRKVHGGRLFQPFTCGHGRIRQAVPRLDANKRTGPFTLHTRT